MGVMDNLRDLIAELRAIVEEENVEIPRETSSFHRQGYRTGFRDCAIYVVDALEEIIEGMET